jgi:HKD family nuclease
MSTSSSSVSNFKAATLFPNTRAVVVGLPSAFKFAAALRESKSLRLATAFAHVGGWKLLANDIIASKGQLYLLTGLHFLQTEPPLLRKWLQLTTDSRVHASLSRSKTTFHPKALIVELEAPRKSFAIVGSGNLSKGAFLKNVECSLYVEDPTYVHDLTRWFDQLFAEAEPLTRGAIEKYEPIYSKARKTLATIRKQEKDAEADLRLRKATVFRNVLQAVASARKYFKSANFDISYKKRVDAVSKMRAALKYPSFTFDKAGWIEFFGVPQFGRLRAVYRDRIFKQSARLRATMSYLVNGSIPVKERVSAVLDGKKYRIAGVGLNIVSKILALHDCSKWPVYNKPVEETLKHFGYETPRGVGKAGKYLLYAREMEVFMRKTGASDVLALDAFFFSYYMQMKEKRRTGKTSKGRLARN